MEPKAENVVQNIGAIAETISVFYNSIARQVPKDVALVLTQHFMDITISRQPAVPSPEVRAVALAAAEAHRQAVAQKRRQQKEALEQQKKAEQAKAESAPETPPQPAPDPAPQPPQDPQPEA